MTQSVPPLDFSVMVAPQEQKKKKRAKKKQKVTTIKCPDPDNLLPEFYSASFKMVLAVHPYSSMGNEDLHCPYWVCKGCGFRGTGNSIVKHKVCSGWDNPGVLKTNTHSLSVSLMNE